MPTNTGNGPSLIAFDFGDTLVSYALESPRGQLDLLAGFWSAVKDGALNKFIQAKSVLELDLLGFCERLNTEREDGAIWPFCERIRHPDFLGPAIPQSLAEELERNLCQIVFNTGALIEGTLAVLAMLKEQGHITAIMSNLPWGTSAELWKLEMYRHGFSQSVIDYIVCCMDVGYRKPHPAGLQRIRDISAFPGNRCLFVGDRMGDIEAAKSAGWIPVLVSDKPRQQLPGVHVISRLGEILRILDSL